MLRQAGAEDARLSSYRDIGDHAALERAGLFVAEGRLIVERLLEDGRYRIHSVAVTPAAADALAETFRKRPDIPVLVCDPLALRELTGFDFHRGCLALAYRLDAVLPPPDLCLATRILAIEGVGNPDNIGGLFRVAFALGIDAILLDTTAADPLYRKAIRTSMGATLRVPYWRVEDWAAAFRALHASGFQVIALTPHSDATPLEHVPITPATRLVFAVGSEGHGLTARVLDHVDVRVRICIDPRADSLNVVVAASIALHALRVK